MSMTYDQEIENIYHPENNTVLIECSMCGEEYYYDENHNCEDQD